MTSVYSVLAVSSELANSVSMIPTYWKVKHFIAVNDMNSHTLNIWIFIVVLVLGGEVTRYEETGCETYLWFLASKYFGNVWSTNLLW